MTIQSKVYINDELQGTVNGTGEQSWDISEFGLDYYTVYTWRIDTYDTESELTTTGDTWWFLTLPSPLLTSGFPYSRFDYYADEGYEDLVYDPIDGEWEYDYDVLARGGGRYKNQLVIIGENCIYYGDVE